jgi:hypothetical protein
VETKANGYTTAGSHSPEELFFVKEIFVNNFKVLYQ